MRRARWLVSVSMVATGALVVPGAAAVPNPPGAPGLDPVELRLVSPRPTVPELPDDPPRALVAGVTALSARLGVTQEPRALEAAARLAPAVAARLAVLVERLLECQVASGHLVAASRAGGEGSAAEVRACAVRLQEAGRWVAQTMPAAAATDAVDLWPVLRYDPGMTDGRYENDYALLVDAGGNDTYLNNAGGNLLDVIRGPRGALSAQPGPARGCHRFQDLATGDCVIASALLIDSGGDDVYGQRQAPDPLGDGMCTADPVVLRIATAGAGFSGVGILIDSAGDDHYVGKSLSQGAAHLGGVGILHDDGTGDDSYLAIRNSQGMGIATGLGVLRDNGGDDIYQWYQPRAIDAAAEFQRGFSGGVIDELGKCDNLPRAFQGVGVAHGAGVLYDRGGDDTYRGAPAGYEENLVPGFNLPTGSQGWGVLGGFGTLDDEAGRDIYEGIAGRGDGVTVQPSRESTGLFMDKA